MARVRGLVTRCLLVLSVTCGAVVASAVGPAAASGPKVVPATPSSCSTFSTDLIFPEEAGGHCLAGTGFYQIRVDCVDANENFLASVFGPKRRRPDTTYSTAQCPNAEPFILQYVLLLTNT
jgi:hypothetical protein